MLVVGLTGGIASGKSTVSRSLQGAGIPVICADELAREAVKPGSPGLEEIRRLFGDEVIDTDGNLDRKAVARVVFSDDSKRKALESIIHPRVSEEKDRILSTLEGQGHSIVVVDVPLLYETDWQRQFDLVIVVYVPKALQEERLIKRDQISREEATSRIAAQMPIEKKKELADRIVDNTGDLAHTYVQVQRLVEELQAMALTEEQTEKANRRSTSTSDVA
jgi:dephospho-CoA kinase